ncbi:YggS family pyridoxal phosphate-dependent enzyme [bacterium]|nr:YggS family pyridoxal phosphate-dependent enzyme [bacterium]
MIIKKDIFVENIGKNVEKILNKLPEGIELVGAAKTKTAEEILEAVKAGVKIIGENYVQESERVIEQIEKIRLQRAVENNLPVNKNEYAIKWHFIGHLQKNKVKKVVKLFDTIETVDSLKIAGEVNKECEKTKKVMPILLEVNSGREKHKFGVFPENVENLVREISLFSNLKIVGLMTMGPWEENAELLRPYFRETRKIFEKINLLNLSNVQMKYLSMGMSNSYRVAIEEGANMIRVGSKIFGERRYQ